MNSRIDSIVNYVWINEKPFEPNTQSADSVLCGVPIHYIDKALNNANRYPEASFNLWFDFNFLDEMTLFFINSVIYFSGAQNIAVNDLNTIENYRNTEIFVRDALYKHPSGYYEAGPYCKYARADLARIIVLKHFTDNHPNTNVFYCDFDIDDVTIYNPDILKKLNEYGMVFGNTKSDAIENGYIALHKTKILSDPYSALDFVETLLESTNSAAMLNNNGWSPLIKTVSSRFSSIDEVVVEGLLRPRGYEIPKPSYLDRLKIC